MSEGRSTTGGPLERVQATAAAFFVLFSSVGLALSGLPLYYHFMGDRFGPRRIITAGILVAGVALVDLGNISTLGMLYFFYKFSYVCDGPLPNQILLSRGFDKSRGKALGVSVLGHRARRPGDGGVAETG
jgi:MFS family permease